MPGRLGCLNQIEAIVTDQCGGPRVCSLVNVASVSWNRVLDDISEAVVEIPVATGIGQNPCCECMGDIEPWCHELHILRNGELVWSGPIVKITYGFSKVVIEARDVLAWLQVRVPQGVLDNAGVGSTIAAASNGLQTVTFTAANPGTIVLADASKFQTSGSLTVIAGGRDVTTLTYTGKSGNTLTGVQSVGKTNGTLKTGDAVTAGNEITDLALDILEGAFSEHDPCVLEFVQQTDLDDRPTLYASTNVSPDGGFAAFDGTYLDWLDNLSGIGLDYTTIGRRILLGVGVGDFEGLPKLGTLLEDHILGEVELAKDGFNMGNRFFVRYQNDDDAAQCAANNPDIPAPPCPSISQSDDIESICYGPIERLNSEGVPFDYTTAKQAGDGYVAAGKFAPRTLDMESGTKLAPDTPWEINDMVPGQRVDVSMPNLCLSTHASFRLTEVQYNLAVGGDEEISISLSPFNQVGGI